MPNVMVARALSFDLEKLPWPWSDIDKNQTVASTTSTHECL